MDIPTKVTDSVKRLNPHLYGGSTIEQKQAAKPSDQPGACQVSKSVSVATVDKLNKTEARYLQWLKRTQPHCRIGIQDITLRLANGVRYTADFSTWDSQESKLTLHEVKGFMRDDAWVKLKVAAHEFPMYDFLLVTAGQAGAWKIMEVKP